MKMGMEDLEWGEVEKILDVTTSAVYKSGGRELTVIGGVAMMMYVKGTTADLDLYLTDVDVVVEGEVLEKHLKKSARSRGCSVSRLLPTKRLSHFPITLPGGKTVRVELMSDTDTRPDTDTALRELGTLIHRKINGVVVQTPSPEALFIMKLSTYGANRARDRSDLMKLYHKINRSKVKSYVVKYGLTERYSNLFRKNDVNFYQTVYQMALRLPDKTLNIALRRLNYPLPETHEAKAMIYAKHYMNVKRPEELLEFKYYLKHLSNKKRSRHQR